MNKFTAIALFLSIFTGLYATSEAERVEEELNKFTPQNEIQLANKLSALGTLKQKVRDYHSAIDLYNQSLHVREKMGEKESSGYALVLYLKSISEFRQGKYCSALENIKNVISIYQKIGDIDSALNAEEEAYKRYQEACSIHMENVAKAE
ncbi:MULTISPECIES: tetratricopeptide repeat protein [Leptospira]|uniref:Tetratricopeptide repeat protein n=3 Tax=Leptospira kirschneri TaxID=29507 RepID=A0A1T1DL97_9LEPT|nr:MULTISPECIES: tetratricopeptide repeat protein [Leptospira]EKO14517.1 tetratricopeptide repeat protein [Leptospira kirschneri str. H1]EKO61556.1 tetratricopeptide repeat protein [Leptospira kirschneri str. H2]EMJ93998.1 tetratricopeptide repeat protein [Leptospira kirschneri str. JB]EMK04390.1 tetratricopeptide repeat protein [Leptospira kirschneri]EMK25408.1 tetratricopeptide repeat protein [Leptospira kirschneri serovar Bulgarica str. Nikolaevo]